MLATMAHSSPSGVWQSAYPTPAHAVEPLHANAVAK